MKNLRDLIVIGDVNKKTVLEVIKIKITQKQLEYQLTSSDTKNHILWKHQKWTVYMYYQNTHSESQLICKK